MENTDPNNPTPPVPPVTPPTEVTPPITPVTPDTPVTPEPVTPTAPVSPDLSGIKTELEGSITEKVSKSIAERIGAALGLNQKQKEELPTDPQELLKMVREESKKGTQEILSEQEKQTQQVADAREKQLTEGATRFQTLWADQYTQLAEGNRVPKIVNAADVNDPGNQAKVKILARLKEILDDNQSKGIDYVPTLKEVFYENPNLLNTATAGGNVPISGGGRAIANNSQSLPYDQLNKATTEELLARKYQN